MISAVRQTILAGGDNCSRVLFIGACLGALNGLDGVPSEWLAQTNEGATVHRLAQKLAGATNL
jgi:ADP-ribosylglycohydrolase